MNWIWWGLIVLLAGWGQGGMQDFRFTPSDEDPHWPTGLMKTWDFLRFRPGLIIGGIALAVILVALFWFLRCSFRLVLLQGILAGRPRILGVFGRTVQPGLAYMAFEFLMLLGIVILLLPLLWAWWPILKAIFQGTQPGWDDIAGLVLATFGWGVPVALGSALVFWFVQDLVLPVLWRRNLGFWAALCAAGRFLNVHLAAVVLFLLARILLSIAGGILACCLVCLTCCFWIWPVMLIAGLGVGAAAFPPALILAIPLILGLAFLMSWGFATVTAPIPVFFRAWSYAFVRELDPGLGEWDPVTGG